MRDIHRLTRRLRALKDKFAALYAQYEAEWSSLATPGSTVDRAWAKLAVRTVYRAAGGSSEVLVFCFESLPAMEIAYRVLSSRRLPSAPCALHDLGYEPQVLHALWDGLVAIWQKMLDASAGVQNPPGGSLKPRLEDPQGLLGQGVPLSPSVRARIEPSLFNPLAPRLQRLRLDTAQLAFAWFCRTVLEEAGTDQHADVLEAHLGVARSCLWWCPFEHIVLLCDRPAEVHVDDGGLHRDGAPAVRWRDGFCNWALHGVIVSKHIAETPGERLDAQLLLQEHNNEVRREIVRKIGIERVCRDLGAKCLDRQGDYELLDLGLNAWPSQPYLKMVNPSVGTYHVEGVHPDCETVAEALAWRNATEQSPLFLT